MAEKLQEKYSAFKKMSLKENSIINDQPLSPTSVESKEVNRSLNFEVECLRQKLRDALGDVKVRSTQIIGVRLILGKNPSILFLKVL